MSDFGKCTTLKKENGRFIIDCKLGLWGVDAPTMEQAINEARHYFIQYRSDGEYSSIIGGESVIDKLMK